MGDFYQVSNQSRSAIGTAMIIETMKQVIPDVLE